MTAVIDGPAWAQQGLGLKAGRYPLAVEAPVLNMTATLMPGLSTQTQFARYYGLYWALADHAERAGLDAEGCRRVVRRSELLLAYVTSRGEDHGVVAHGADAILRGLEKERRFWALADTGKDTYSPRTWGFWSQYSGPSDVLGTVRTERRALRSGRHRCPRKVRKFYEPLVSIAASTAEPDPDDVLPVLQPYDLGNAAGPDLDALGELFAASRDGHHDTLKWTDADRSRRASLRILARAGSLYPDASWLVAMRNAVAYGATCDTDHVLRADAERAAAWRGLLLRHRSVGAWRRLWAGLVDHIVELRLATRDDLHAWVAHQLPDEPVAAFMAELPPVIDGSGQPLDAETLVEGRDVSTAARDVAVLLLGAYRVDTMSGAAGVAFRGSRAFLDPVWVAHQLDEHGARSVRDLGRALVDDMLAQSRRVALRKMLITGAGMTVFSRVHERNGLYTAGSREGGGNVGLRIAELASLGIQLGLLSQADGSVTDQGRRLLGVPR